MELTTQQLSQLKSLQLDMLAQFVDVCRRLDLRYYLMGGTMLGAVRHGGFIPWDDDVDVGMPRQDYEVFLQKAQALLDQCKAEAVWIDMEGNLHYSPGFQKLIRT